MHRSCLFVCVATLSLLAAGCTPKKKAPPPQPAWPITSPETVAAIREAYHRQYPNSRVGVVTATRSQDHLVAISGVSGYEFQIDQVVTFINDQQRVLTTGTIVRILPDGVHASYAPPAPGLGREPRVGDLMVRF